MPGFTDSAGYSSVQLQTYLTDLLGGISGSQWFNSQTQYCQGVAAGATACAGQVAQVGSIAPSVQYWFDSSSPSPTDAGVFAEADAAAAHFNLVNDINATVLVLTPMGQSYFTTGGTQFCGYHGYTSNVIYAYIPWIPDGGVGCGLNAVNGTNDSFGHGHFDGFSLVVGHEVAETATDPLPDLVDTSTGAVTYGWAEVDPGPIVYESGDKCVAVAAWPYQDLVFGSVNNFFAMQPLWTDAGATCAIEDLGGASASRPAVSSWGSDRRDVFVRGANNALWHNAWIANGWTGWESLGGGLQDGPAAVSWGPNRLDVFVRGLDNGLWHRAWTASNGWFGWEPLGGALTAGPTVASWGSNRLDAFVRGSDNTLWHLAWTAAGWTGWQGLGGGLTSAPTAVSWGLSRIDVFARGGDMAIWHLAWTGTTWYGWEPRGGGFSSGPGVASTATGLLEVYAVGLDSGIWFDDWRGTTWTGWSTLEGGWSTDPAPISPPGTEGLELYLGGSNLSAARLVPGF